MHTKPKAQAAPQTPGPCSHCKAQTIPEAEQARPCSAAPSPASSPPPLTSESAQHAFLEFIRSLARASAQMDHATETRAAYNPRPETGIEDP
jgi:hypothetical protein